MIINKLWINTVLSITAVLMFSSAHAALIVNYSALGDFTGFQNININGTLYNVELKEGTFDDVYGGVGGLTFTDEASAVQAGRVLASTWYDLVPRPTSSELTPDSLAYGCGTFRCFAFTAYDADSDYVYTSANGVTLDTFDPYCNNCYLLDSYANLGSTSAIYTRGGDVTNDSYSVWATYSLAPVPVPPAIWLFGSGLLGLVGVARRKKA